MGLFDAAKQFVKDTADDAMRYKAEYRECDDDELKRLWRSSTLSYTKRVALSAVMKERGLK